MAMLVIANRYSTDKKCYVRRKLKEIEGEGSVLGSSQGCKGLIAEGAPSLMIPLWLQHEGTPSENISNTGL